MYFTFYMYEFIQTHMQTHIQQNNEGKWEQRHHFQGHKSIVRSLASIPGDTDAASPSIHVVSSSDDGLVKIWKCVGSEVVCRYAKWHTSGQQQHQQ
jgi:WD40 repeat protein